MPCYSDPHDYCDHLNGKCLVMVDALRESHKHVNECLDRFKNETNLLTDMLCRLLTKIEITDYQTHAYTQRLDDDIQEWWDKHKEWDKNRG